MSVEWKARCPPKHISAKVENLPLQFTKKTQQIGIWMRTFFGDLFFVEKMDIFKRKGVRSTLNNVANIKWLYFTPKTFNMNEQQKKIYPAQLLVFRRCCWFLSFTHLLHATLDPKMIFLICCIFLIIFFTLPKPKSGRYIEIIILFVEYSTVLYFRKLAFERLWMQSR